jgi:hypothetical protein
MTHVQWLIYCVISSLLVVTVPANINLTIRSCHPLVVVVVAVAVAAAAAAAAQPHFIAM